MPAFDIGLNRDGGLTHVLDKGLGPRGWEDVLEVAGEHIMAGAEPLRVRKDFFGADEAITDFKPGKDHWVATLIFVGESPQKVQARREATINELKKYFGLTVYRDPAPGND